VWLINYLILYINCESAGCAVDAIAVLNQITPNLHEIPCQLILSSILKYFALSFNPDAFKAKSSHLTPDRGVLLVDSELEKSNKRPQPNLRKWR